MLKKIFLSGDISIWGYLHNKKVFCYKLLSIFIYHQDLSFGGISLKIEFIVIVYKLINCEIIFLLLGYVTSTSDLQPITAIANPGQLVYTQITTRGPNCFEFIIAFIMPSRNIGDPV